VITDRDHLLNRQYRDGSNLDARIALHDRFSRNRYGWYRWLFDRLLVLPATCHILELGCGTARLWWESLDRVPPGWRITLTDLSPGMVEEARQSLAGSGGQFVFAVVDAENIPFPDESFDAVLANHMLYHLANRPRALREIRRVLRPDGRFFASTVGEDHLRELDDLVTRVVPGLEEEPGGVKFNLERGPAEVAAIFSDVIVERYEDALVVTEAEPLIAYLLSMRIASVMSEEQLTQLTSLVEREVVAQGAIGITKDSGLIVGRRPGISR
jgi:SAM-dependent methyltransferase